MRTKKTNKILSSVLGLVLILLTLWGGVKYYDHTHPFQIKYFDALGYGPSEIEVILLQDDQTKTEILEQAYVPNIIKHLTIEHYSSLVYQGYTEEEIDLILSLETNRLNFVLDQVKSNDLLMWVQQTNFIPRRFQRYLDTQTSKVDFSVEDVLEWVNSDRDRAFYTDIQASDPELGNLVLVNKYNALSDVFVPSDLESIAPYGQVKLTRDAAEAFKELASDANEEGYTIVGISGYRSYQTQVALYQRYLNKDGRSLADTYSARAGHSEHQTGLAIDVASNNSNILTFEQSKSFKWMFEHAHEYGFILRYPKGKEHITGYKYEPWHYRYVGIELATILKENGMTFDEYAAVFVLN